jgi:hypothetical protein
MPRPQITEISAPAVYDRIENQPATAHLSELKGQ